MKARYRLLKGVITGALCLATSNAFSAPVASNSDTTTTAAATVTGGKPTKATSAPASTTAGLLLSSGPQAGSSGISSKESMAYTDNYWTQDKRDKAIPREAEVNVTSVSGAPVASSVIAEPEPAVVNDGWAPKARVGRDLPIASPMAWGTYPFPYTRYKTSLLKNTYPESTVGKLFFTMSGINYVCSASVIGAHLLITARHCVYDYGSGAWATNVVFYPGYDSGKANTRLGPSNGWLGRQNYTWVSGASGWQYDIGFIQVFNQNRTGCAAQSGNPTVASYTGTLGYKYGGSYDARQFDIFGYPQASPFSGKFPYQCETSTGSLNTFGETNTFEVGCDMTGGSSGGPWLDTYKLNESGAMNYVTSVTSFKWTSPSRPQSLNGPQFMTGNFYNLLVGANSLACP